MHFSACNSFAIWNMFKNVLIPRSRCDFQTETHIRPTCLLFTSPCSAEYLHIHFSWGSEKYHVNFPNRGGMRRLQTSPHVRARGWRSDLSHVLHQPSGRIRPQYHLQFRRWIILLFKLFWICCSLYLQENGNNTYWAASSIGTLER
jgi:hypothetical protein